MLKTQLYEYLFYFEHHCSKSAECPLEFTHAGLTLPSQRGEGRAPLNHRTMRE